MSDNCLLQETIEGLEEHICNECPYFGDCDIPPSLSRQDTNLLKDKADRLVNQIIHLHEVLRMVQDGIVGNFAETRRFCGDILSRAKAEAAIEKGL